MRFRVGVEVGIESDSGMSSYWVSAWSSRPGLELSLGLSPDVGHCPFPSGVQGMVTKLGALTGEPG